MKLFNENCIEGMKKLKESSIDLIVTDPPYGLKFMGKKWDKTLPPKEAFKQMVRVLKPGAFAFIMCTPRSDLQARMSLLLENAGFNIGFTPIYWTYATGFPKATNISKQIDKRKGSKRKQIENKTGRLHHNTNLNDDGWDKIGSNKTMMDSNEPVTEEAQKYNGAYGGYQPKPAVEVIIVAMKPRTEKTYVDQCLSNGHGITWLDDCRIPSSEDTRRNSNGVNGIDTFKIRPQNKEDFPKQKGRFPANLLVSNDALNDGRIIQYKSKQDFKISRGNIQKDRFLGGLDIPGRVTPSYSDKGSYSKYFDLDAWFAIIPKASPKEKNQGLEHFPDKIKENATSTGKRIDKRHGSRNMTVKPIITKNTHPTVKPIKLMSYLITLGSRPQPNSTRPLHGIRYNRNSSTTTKPQIHRIRTRTRILPNSKNKNTHTDLTKYYPIIKLLIQITLLLTLLLFLAHLHNLKPYLFFAAYKTYIFNYIFYSLGKK